MLANMSHPRIHRLAAALAVALFVVVPACSAKSNQVHRPQGDAINRSITERWAGEIRKVARDGDWILTRSYSLLGDVIVAATPGESVSHASIYDRKSDTIIESVEGGVREVSLESLLDRNHFAMVVRPSGMGPEAGTRAVARARAKVGFKYDVSGLAGFDDPQAYYCSELVYWASQVEKRVGEKEIVIAPSALLKYGHVIYWSGTRNDPALLKAARAKGADGKAPPASPLPAVPPAGN
jgi:hypothetical protein